MGRTWRRLGIGFSVAVALAERAAAGPSPQEVRQRLEDRAHIYCPHLDPNIQRAAFNDAAARIVAACGRVPTDRQERCVSMLIGNWVAEQCD